MDECLSGLSLAAGTFSSRRICVYVIFCPRLNPSSLKITEDKPLFQLAARILGKMADEATNQTSTGSNLD